MGKRMSLPALPSGDFRRSMLKSSKGTNAALVEHRQTHMRVFDVRILLLWLTSVRARGGRSASASTSRPARALARVAGPAPAGLSGPLGCKFAHWNDLWVVGARSGHLSISARSLFPLIVTSYTRCIK